MHPVVQQISDRVSLVARQADIDSDFFPAALNTQRFGAEERGAHLLRQAVQGQAIDSGLGFKPHFDFPFAFVHVIAHIEYPGDQVQLLFNRRHSAGQGRIRVRGNFDLDRFSEVEQLRGEKQAANARGRAHGLTPTVLEILRRERPQFRIEQF